MIAAWNGGGRGSAAARDGGDGARQRPGTAGAALTGGRPGTAGAARDMHGGADGGRCAGERATEDG